MSFPISLIITIILHQHDKLIKLLDKSVSQLEVVLITLNFVSNEAAKIETEDDSESIF